MDDYPSAYVAQSRPLIFLSGWSKPRTSDTSSQLSNGPRIRSELPSINSPRGQELQDAFLSFDLDASRGTNLQSSASQPSPLMLFRLRSCGRQFAFPCRKASPSASEVGAPLASPGTTSLHSPLSPLTKGSPVYIDGIMTPLWPLKYHEAVPAVLLLFFSISHDPQNDVLRDNHLKTEINSIKIGVTESNYRTKVAVVLVATDSMRQSSDVEERLANIRKATKLDTKSTFFYLPPEVSSPDLILFAESVLSALRPACSEFYKSQYKHSRRKKDKKGESNPSSPSIEGISQNLSKSGWNVRYEYKMAILSEFRLETDTAARHYKEVVDLLLGPAGLFDLYSSWSPRWNELRLLADSSALRRIRCLLASGLPSAAAKFWKTYHDLTRTIVDRKGKGSSTYGWQAWESRLARCMSDILQASFRQITDSIARKTVDVLDRKQKHPYAPPEKTSSSDIILPWSYLHHPGYWLYYAARHAQIRGALAMAIPEEDLTPPGQSPAARVAHRNEHYETYLCPEPHVEGNIFDHKQQVMDILEHAITEFSARDQEWMADRLRFAIAEKLTQGSNPVTSPLQNSWRMHRWRRAGWGVLTRHIAHDLWLLAVQSNDFQTQILTTWELLDSRLDKSNVAVYDLEGLLKRISNSMSNGDTRIDMQINGEEISSFINLDFVFERESENLGEELRAQAIIYSNAHPDSKPVQFSKVIINFQGDMPDIHIHDNSDVPTETAHSAIHKTFLRKSSDQGNNLLGEAPLTLYPRQTLVFALSLPLRESGKISAFKALAIIEKPSLSIEYSESLTKKGDGARWRITREQGLSRQRRSRWTACRELNVLPKLPKLKIRLPNLADVYYVGERAVIDIEIINDESWDVEGSMEVRIPGDHPGVSQPALLASVNVDGDSDLVQQNGQNCRIGKLAHSEVDKRTVAIQMPLNPSDDINFEIEVKYNGSRESDSDVSKTTSAKLNIVEPVKVTFMVSPHLHPEPWPSYFAIPDALTSPGGSANPAPSGLTSRWSLRATILCLADDSINIDKTELGLQGIGDGSISSVALSSIQPATIARGEDHEVNFTIDVTKANLEDTTPSAFDPTLTIHWRRTSGAETTYFKKVLAAPRLILPTNEPRVIATRVPSDDETVLIDIHLENPSMHYLTFELGIEASDDYAFSGPKLAIVHLVPMSRHCVRFVLMPLVRGAFIQATFKAVDVYFNKSLRVNAGTGLRRDSAGSLLIWIDSEP